jgi:hypothetical protein
LNSPVELVTVCAIASLFVHVTIVFTATVREEGLKAMFAIVTELPPLPGPGPGFGDGFVYELEDLEQLTSKNNANILTGIKAYESGENFLIVFI